MPQIEIDSKLLKPQVAGNLLLKPHLSSKTETDAIKRRMSGKLNRGVSLSRAQCTRSDQIQSTGLTPGMRTKTNGNESFSFARSMGASNPFLQGNSATKSNQFASSKGASRTPNPFLQSCTATKPNQTKKYNYPILKCNGENSEILGMNPNLNCYKSTISFSTTSRPSSSPLKKCLSVST